jgi:hypothetical protein
LRRRWTKIAVLLYPALTLFCIVVTANHFWLDGVGGLLAFGIGALIGWGFHRWNQDRLDRRHVQLLAVAGEGPAAESRANEVDAPQPEPVDATTLKAPPSTAPSQSDSTTIE